MLKNTKNLVNLYLKFITAMNVSYNLLGRLRKRAMLERCPVNTPSSGKLEPAGSIRPGWVEIYFRTKNVFINGIKLDLLYLQNRHEL